MLSEIRGRESVISACHDANAASLQSQCRRQKPDEVTLKFVENVKFADELFYASERFGGGGMTILPLIVTRTYADPLVVFLPLFNALSEP